VKSIQDKNSIIASGTSLIFEKYEKFPMKSEEIVYDHFGIDEKMSK